MPLKKNTTDVAQRYRWYHWRNDVPEMTSHHSSLYASFYWITFRSIFLKKRAQTNNGFPIWFHRKIAISKSQLFDGKSRWKFCKGPISAKNIGQFTLKSELENFRSTLHALLHFHTFCRAEPSHICNGVIADDDAKRDDFLNGTLLISIEKKMNQISTQHFWQWKRQLCVRLLEVISTTWEKLQIAKHNSFRQKERTLY